MSLDDEVMRAEAGAKLISAVFDAIVELAIRREEPALVIERLRAMRDDVTAQFEAESD